MKKLISILISVVTLTTSCLTKNEKNINIQATNEEIQPITTIVFEERIIDIGDVAPDTILTQDYQFKNTGDYNLKIDFIQTDCSCSDYKINSETIPPGEKGYIKLFLDTSNKVGKQIIHATMSCNTDDKFYLFILKCNVVSG